MFRLLRNKTKMYWVSNIQNIPNLYLQFRRSNSTLNNNRWRKFKPVLVIFTFLFGPPTGYFILENLFRFWYINYGLLNHFIFGWPFCKCYYCVFNRK